MATVAGVLYGYASFLFGGGLIGFAAAGFAAKAKTALIVGAGSALVALCCGVAADVRPTPKKGEDGFKRWMIGVHLGLLLPVILAPVFVWRAVKALGIPEKAYLGKLFIVLAAGARPRVWAPCAVVWCC